MNRVAYPHRPVDLARHPYDISKWVNTSSQIYALHFQGIPLSQAISQTIQSWEDKEQQDFKNWLKFYQEQGNLKYSKAQVYPTSFLKAQVPGIPTPPTPGPNVIQTPGPEQEEKELIKKKISGIIGRLDAAERLATKDLRVRDILGRVLGIDLDEWLTLLHQVKRKIQSAPIIKLQSTLLEDLIIKQANLLRKNGKSNMANELIFIAQEMVAPPPGSTPAPTPSPTPEMPVEDGKKPIDDFLKAINGDEGPDENESDDELDSNDIIDPEPDDLANIHILAQMVPPEAMTAPNSKETLGENTLHQETDKSSKIDEALDAALQNVTVQDVINALEGLANLLRNREVPRILSKVDLMMNKLNISSFFPALAEASNKSLESNQYALTRIDDILSKLRGVVNSPNEINLSDLQGDPSQGPLQVKLENERQTEQAIKEKRRKEQKMQDLAPVTPPAPAAAPELNQAQPQIQPSPSTV